MRRPSPLRLRGLCRWVARAGLVWAFVCCAPKPERDASIVRDLRVLALAADLPGQLVPQGPPDEAHPLYTFAAAPAGREMRALVVDPRAPLAPVRFSAWACLAAHQPCDLEDSRTRVLVRDAVGTPEILTFDADFSAADLNTWVAEDPYRGYDRLSVRIELFVEGFEGAQARAQTVVTFRAPEFLRNADRGIWEPRQAFENPKEVFVVPAEVSPRTAINLLEDRTWDLPPGGTLFMALLGDYVFVDVAYTLPTGEQRYPRRSIRSHAEVVSLYTVSGRVSPPVFVATEPDGFGYVAPPRARFSVPDVLYIVVHDDSGGCAWARWTMRRSP